jgi:tetratricopeptide (TPR) repeat protein
MMYLYRQSGAGTLFVRSGSGAEAWIRVRGGRAIAARTTEGGASLMQALMPACGFTSGEFAFYDGDHLETVDGSLASAPTISGSLDPYALLYASLRDHTRDDMVEGVLARYPFAKLKLPKDRDIGRLGLDEIDKLVVEPLRKAPATIDQIIANAQLPALHTRRLLYALLVTHMLAPEETRSTDLYRSQVDLDVEDNGRAATPLRVSTVEAPRPGTPPSEGKPAAPRVVIKPPVAGTVNEVGSATMPAWQRLISMRPPGAPSADPRKTGDFTPVRAPSPLRASLATPLNDPAAKRRRVEQLMQGSRFVEALSLLDELVGSEPSDAKLHGLRARALFEAHRAETDGLPKSVLEAIRKAHELDADEANAFFVRGLIFKQAGETQKAIACWKRALVTDPKHLDAQREIRIAQMRK